MTSRHHDSMSDKSEIRKKYAWVNSLGDPLMEHSINRPRCQPYATAAFWQHLANDKAEWRYPIWVAERTFSTSISSTVRLTYYPHTFIYTVSFTNTSLIIIVRLGTKWSDDLVKTLVGGRGAIRSLDAYRHAPHKLREFPRCRQHWSHLCREYWGRHNVVY